MLTFLSCADGESMQRTGFQNINRQLSFEDEAMGSQSCIVRDASLLSREHNEKSEPVTISPQLLILNKLEYRKLFLLLSYTKGLVNFCCVVVWDIHSH